MGRVGLVTGPVSFFTVKVLHNVYILFNPIRNSEVSPGVSFFFLMNFLLWEKDKLNLKISRVGGWRWGWGSVDV